MEEWNGRYEQAVAGELSKQITQKEGSVRGTPSPQNNRTLILV